MKSLFRSRYALVLGLLTAACATPSDTVPWTPPAATPPPPPEAMYLELEQGDLAVADGIMNDVWPARGFPAAKLAWPLTWNEDPYNDAFFRFMFYSLRYTEHLLFAYRTTNEQRYLDKLYAILRSFIAHEPDRAYDHHKLDNEHATAYRVMVLTNLYVKLNATSSFPKDVADGIRTSLVRSATFLMEPRRFESWANHGFTQAAALLVIAHNLPDLEDAPKWRATGIERLEVMRTTNIDADGVDIENSPFYHLFVLGLVTQIGAWAAEYEPSIAPSWETTKRAMIRYLAYVTQPNGRLPALGATGTTIVANQDPMIYGPLSAIDPEFAWVWSRNEGGTAPLKRAELFPTAGLFVLRAPRAAAEQTFVTFDSGVYRTDHSHLDALSTTIYSDGAALVPDAGLYTYDRGEEYDYFHGTRAHNTVVVDGKDQPEGAARPGAYGVVGAASWATGESTLYDGVTHRRTVVILDQGLVLVTDDLAGDGPHDYRQTWHFFPGAELTMDGLDANVNNIKSVPILFVRQAEPAGLTVTHAYGQEKPLQGWVSLAYSKKEPAHAVEYLRRSASTSFATLFVAGRRARSGTPASVRQAVDAATGDRVLSVCADQADLTVRIRHEGTALASVEISGGGC
jgi:hypothetical protein